MTEQSFVSPKKFPYSSGPFWSARLFELWRKRDYPNWIKVAIRRFSEKDERWRGE